MMHTLLQYMAQYVTCILYYRRTGFNCVVTPRACARGKVIGFVCRCLSLSVVSTKVAGSGDLGV